MSVTRLRSKSRSAAGGIEESVHEDEVETDWSSSANLSEGTDSDKFDLVGYNRQALTDATRLHILTTSWAIFTQVA